MTRTVGDSLITGSIDTYMWLMIIFGLVAIVAFFAILLWIMGLPGKIAIQRNHPHAETVKIMGYAGMLPVFPWIHAFIWAFHDSVTVDVRRFPDAEAKAIEAEINKLTGKEDQTGSEEPPAEPTRIEIDRPTRLPDPGPKT